MAISEQQKPKTHILLARCLSLASSTLLYFHALMLVVCKISMQVANCCTSMHSCWLSARFPCKWQTAVLPCAHAGCLQDFHASGKLLYFHALMLVVCKISMEPLGEDVHVMSVVKRIIVSAVVKEAGPRLTVLF